MVLRGSIPLQAEGWAESDSSNSRRAMNGEVEMRVLGADWQTRPMSHVEQTRSLHAEPAPLSVYVRERVTVRACNATRLRYPL